MVSLSACSIASSKRFWSFGYTISSSSSSARRLNVSDGEMFRKWGQRRGLRSGSSDRDFFIPYELSAAQRLFLIPYFGVGAFKDPERGDLVAGLGDVTASTALSKLHRRMATNEVGRQLLETKPLINEESLDIKRLRLLPDSSLGKQYLTYMDQHGFSADERTSVRFMTDADHAFIMTRYRQVHDFWHVLSGLPPSLLGEIALKWFEYYHTGLPVCYLSGAIGPLRLNFRESRQLWSMYRPWAERCASECADLLSFKYENYLHEDVETVRKMLRFSRAPSIKV
jgi:ubiquinone biosynthesis protein COQ4